MDPELNLGPKSVPRWEEGAGGREKVTLAE